MSELYFNFEGKEYKAKLTVKKHATLDFYYVSLIDQELINRFSISYIFGYARSLGVQDISSFQRPENKPLVECLCHALELYIKSKPGKEQVENTGI